MMKTQDTGDRRLTALLTFVADASETNLSIAIAEDRTAGKSPLAASANPRQKLGGDNLCLRRQDAVFGRRTDKRAAQCNDN